MGWLGRKKRTSGEGAREATSPGAARPGQSIGRYTIKKMIGKGGMGAVYLAQDPLIGRQVAIKVISVRPDLAEEEAQQYRERFLREAQAAGALIHPNIIAVHDIGQDPATRQPYIVMEFMEGQDLKKVILSRAPLPEEEAVRIALQIASALDYAHRRGIVHRDIKPANILINDRGQVKITDFGVARLPGSDLTRSDQFVGSPGFMSPEQLKGAAVDGRSDLFALGVILYELLTGKAPFDGNSVSEVLYKISTQPADPPSETHPDVSADFDPILERALHKDPAKRYQNGREMIEALRAVTEGGETAPAPARPARTSARKSRRGGRASAHRVSGIWNLSSGWRLALFAGVLLATLAGVNWAIHQVFTGSLGERPGRGAAARDAASRKSAADRSAASPTARRAGTLAAVGSPPASSFIPAKGPEPGAIVTAPAARAAAPAPGTTGTATRTASPATVRAATARPAPSSSGRIKVELSHRLRTGRLIVLVDGKTVLSKPFDAPKGRSAGTVSHTLSVAPGRHGLEVRVLGAKGEVRAKSRITGTIAKNRTAVLLAEQRPQAGKTLSLEWAAGKTAPRRTASR